MINLIHKIFTSTAFKLILRIIASLASAIVVISGYLFFLNMQNRNKDIEVPGESSKKEDDNQEDQNESVEN